MKFIFSVATSKITMVLNLNSNISKLLINKRC